VFAEKVRDHKELVSRWAVLQETRVEYFRGKDFVSFLKNNPELKDILESDRNLETEEIANILLGKNLLVRCDRVVKTVRPGKKKLSTWPAHLEIFPVSVVYSWFEPSFCNYWAAMIISESSTCMCLNVVCQYLRNFWLCIIDLFDVSFTPTSCSSNLFFFIAIRAGGWVGLVSQVLMLEFSDHFYRMRGGTENGWWEKSKINWLKAFKRTRFGK